MVVFQDHRKANTSMVFCQNIFGPIYYMSSVHQLICSMYWTQLCNLIQVLVFYAVTLNCSLECKCQVAFP